MPIEDSNDDTNVLEWSKEYRLTWNDFQRVPLIKRQAESAVGFRRKFTDTIIFERGGKMIFQITCEGVLCYFNREESWVLEKQKTSSNQEMILKHEQGHFDLMEIHVREYRNKIKELCKKTFECLGKSKKERKVFSEKKGKKLLDAIERSISAKCIAEQMKYDEITNYGQKESEQLEYLKEIEQRLEN